MLFEHVLGTTEQTLGSRTFQNWNIFISNRPPRGFSISKERERCLRAKNGQSPERSLRNKEKPPISQFVAEAIYVEYVSVADHFALRSPFYRHFFFHCCRNVRDVRKGTTRKNIDSSILPGKDALPLSKVPVLGSNARVRENILFSMQFRHQLVTIDS